eukprot:5697967-Pyramimonas_sp.AAC.1
MKCEKEKISTRPFIALGEANTDTINRRHSQEKIWEHRGRWGGRHESPEDMGKYGASCCICVCVHLCVLGPLQGRRAPTQTQGIVDP